MNAKTFCLAFTLTFVEISSSLAGTKQLEVIVINIGNESFYKSPIFNEYLMILINSQAT